MPQIEFSIYCGLKGSQINHIENEKQKVTFEIIEKIIEKFPEFKLWILSGEEYPEIGQISPMTKEVAEKLNG